VRLPAAYNGIFGLKPSLGRVPIYPPYLGRVVGPLTRNVTDAALLMAALSRPMRVTTQHCPIRRSIGPDR